MKRVAGSECRYVEMDHPPEGVDAVGDLCLRESLQLFQAEFFYTERGHYGPHDNCPLDVLIAGIPGHGILIN